MCVKKEVPSPYIKESAANSQNLDLQHFYRFEARLWTGFILWADRWFCNRQIWPPRIESTPTFAPYRPENTKEDFKSHHFVKVLLDICWDLIGSRSEILVVKKHKIMMNDWFTPAFFWVTQMKLIWIDLEIIVSCKF